MPLKKKGGGGREGCIFYTYKILVWSLVVVADYQSYFLLKKQGLLICKPLIPTDGNSNDQYCNN